MPPRPAKKVAGKRPTPTKLKKADPTPEPEAIVAGDAPAGPEKVATDVLVEDTPRVPAPVSEEKASSVQEVCGTEAVDAILRTMEPSVAAGGNEEAGDHTEDPEEHDENGSDGNMEIQSEEGNLEDVALGSVDKAEDGNAESVDNPEENAEQDDEDGETDEEENADVDKEDPSLYMHTPSEESRKRKELEIFVGGLNTKVTEDDLIKTFSEYGVVQSVKITKNHASNKNKRFAFIQYTNVEQAKKALAELKGGTEVHGKLVTVSPSTANDILYLGNICKTWTADQVRETIKGLGVELNFEILIPSDPSNEGNSKGFAFLEFTNHFDAMAAFECLKSPGAKFGRDKIAKVAFSHSMRHVSEEDLAQVKTVYVEGFPSSWDEEQIKELCKQYGEVETVKLSRNFARKRKRPFGFIGFTSRESALACVEGLNNSQVGEGETKVCANLARYDKRRPSKPSGELKVEGDETDEVNLSKKNTEETNVENSTQKSKRFKKIEQKNKSNKFSGRKKGGHEQKMSESSAGRKRRFKGMETEFEARPNKRQGYDHGFGNARGRQSPYARGTAGYAGHHPDLEPHAGLIHAGRRGYSSGQYDSQAQYDAFVDRGGGIPFQHGYSGYAHYPGHQATYRYASRALPPRRPYY